VIAAAWAAAALKLLAAALPVIAVRQANRPDRSRLVLVLAWAAAAILCAYGLVLTGAGILVQTGVIHAAATADHGALAWHAYLWDPWFLIWGLLAGNALRQVRLAAPRD
jgi:Protein of unknown function (DUF3995)